MSARRKSKIKLYIPARVSLIYTGFAVILVPWTVYLAYSLPRKHLERHWDVTWVGLDIAIIFLLLITGFLASLKSRLVILSLVATASFLLVDAWFDVTNSGNGNELVQSIILAIIFEIPIAIMGFYLAYKTLSKNID